MTRIKICGLKRIEDIEAVNYICPEYVGFVFADFSHRYVDKETAAELKAALNPKIKAVGVFVDEDYNYVAELLNEGIIDIAQLHGNEDEDYIGKLRGLISNVNDESGPVSGEKTPGVVKIIKAFNMSRIKSTGEIEESSADMVLVDSGTGSGKTFDWNRLGEIKRPYILAGGLEPDNVSAAIKSLHPYGVDVSSGVESDKYKDPEKMKRFVSIIREENDNSLSM